MQRRFPQASSNLAASTHRMSTIAAMNSTTCHLRTRFVHVSTFAWWSFQSSLVQSERLRLPMGLTIEGGHPVVPRSARLARTPRSQRRASAPPAPVSGGLGVGAARRAFWAEGPRRSAPCDDHFRCLGRLRRPSVRRLPHQRCRETEQSARAHALARGRGRGVRAGSRTPGCSAATPAAYSPDALAHRSCCQTTAGRMIWTPSTFCAIGCPPS